MAIGLQGPPTAITAQWKILLLIIMTSLSHTLAPPESFFLRSEQYILGVSGSPASYILTLSTYNSVNCPMPDGFGVDRAPSPH